MLISHIQIDTRQPCTKSISKTGTDISIISNSDEMNVQCFFRDLTYIFFNIFDF